MEYVWCSVCVCVCVYTMLSLHTPTVSLHAVRHIARTLTHVSNLTDVCGADGHACSGPAVGHRAHQLPPIRTHRKHSSPNHRQLGRWEGRLTYKKVDRKTGRKNKQTIDTHTERQCKLTKKPVNRPTETGSQDDRRTTGTQEGRQTYRQTSKQRFRQTGKQGNR